MFSATCYGGFRERRRSERSVVDHLRSDEALHTILVQDAASYSYAEILDSVNKMFGWNLDLRKIAGTEVKILHGASDTLVHPDNAKILERMLKEAGVTNVEVKFFSNQGHLLLRVQADKILTRAKGEAKPGASAVRQGGK